MIVGSWSYNVGECKCLIGDALSDYIQSFFIKGTSLAGDLDVWKDGLMSLCWLAGDNLRIIFSWLAAALHKDF
jgi:hypothetical protein